MRRLAAILAADVVGYSRLMSINEAETLDAVRSSREVAIEPQIASRSGRVVKLMGDGLLAEFPSAVEAVECAVAAQEAAHSRAEGVPDERRILWRIGINIGDIIAEEDDIYGDGVNIAARLEGLAEPGGICLSGSVFDQVHNKLQLPFEDLGEKEIKNIPEPVRVYRVGTGTDITKSVRSGRTARHFLASLAAAIAIVSASAVLIHEQFPTAPAPSAIPSVPPVDADGPSVAVLPFLNRSDIADQDYFAEGLTDDIITELTKVPGLMIIARESTVNYRDQSPKLEALARELNVRYVLQGSVRRSHDRVRINANLIEASSGRHLWGDRYDGELTDVFVLQDRITEQIAAALSLTLSPADRENLTRQETADLKAYELFLRGRTLFFRFSRQDTYRARELFGQSLVRDPKFARARAMLAWTHAFEYTNGWSENPAETLDRALELANRAIELDNRLPVANFVKGLVYREKRDYAAAMAEAQRAVELDPNYANAYVLMATLLYYAGRPQEGLGMIARAEKINPVHPSNYPFHKAQALFILKRYDEAIDTLREGLAQNPTSQRMRVWLAASYAQAGRLEDAQWETETLLAQDPNLRLSRLFHIFPFKDPADLENFNSALRKVGIDDRW